MLQLHSNFDMKAFKALITSKVVVTKVEVEVVATHRAALDIMGTSSEEVETEAPVGALKVVKVKKEDKN